MEYLTFQNGSKMPVVGLGLGGSSRLENEAIKMEPAIDSALEFGYRHFDSGFIYSTEETLGKCITKWTESGKGKREQLFITSKLPWHGMQPHLVEHFLTLSLKRLNLSYLDLYLIHWPIGLKYIGDDEHYPTDENGVAIIDPATDLEAIWKAMEAQVNARRAKSIGISNFTASQVERIISTARILPANVQVEVHAYFQQKEFIKFCSVKGITVCAYCPLGSPYKKIQAAKSGHQAAKATNLLTDPVIVAIGEKHGKRAAQILLRYLIQLGVAVIPKSSNDERVSQNIDIFNFKLDVDDTKLLDGLDQGEAGRSVRTPTPYSHHPETPF